MSGLHKNQYLRRFKLLLKLDTLEERKEDEKRVPALHQRHLSRTLCSGPFPMKLDKSKEWTGGVGMVLEWYYEMMPSGHVASPALRMELEESLCPP